MSRSGLRFGLVCALLGMLLAGPVAWAQQSASAPAKPADPPVKDPLGRDTPRGTVLGFMNAARAARDDVTPQYLNTRLKDRAAIDLVHQLFVVLDSRLPPRISELSDRPEGSLANPLKPDQDVVGTITTASGPLDLVLERVDIRGSGLVWVFSRKTLESIPDAYGEVNLVSIDRFLPDFLTRPRVAGIRLFEWLALGLIVPLGYWLWGLVGQLLRPPVRWWLRRRGHAGELPTTLVPGALRLLLLAVTIRWLIASVELPLRARQFWTIVATMLTISAGVWALLVSNGYLERYIFRRLQGSGYAEISAMLRLTRRIADALIIAAGGLVTLYYFGVDPTAALAGLGIGGIAVALAAQKTLENVIGGLSIIFDKAVRVGDFLKLGETLGTVDHIGLRSTRIRTQDRTIVSVPNGQISNVTIETLSARDKFWFRHVVGLRYETTPSQVRAIVDGIRAHLAAHPAVDPNESIRVRFFRFGRFSLDLEVFAYIAGTDWEGFLDTQQDLLLAVMEIVERAGAVIALPSQTVHFADTRAAAGGAARLVGARESRRGASAERGIPR